MRNIKPTLFTKGKKYLLLTILMGTVSLLFSQRQANVWVFGENTGLDLNCTPPCALRETKARKGEGYAAISNACGDLLFYTEGDTIWDANHKIVPGATNLKGSRLATQSSLILPYPGDPTKYLFFQVDDNEGGNIDGLTYSTVVSTTGGTGLLSANTPLVGLTNEMITAVDNALGTGYWVIVKMKNKAEFRAFEVTRFGVNATPVISSAGTASAESCQMKASPDGTMLAIRLPLQLFNFNSRTGKVTDLIQRFNNPFLDQGNSVEFSSDSKRLYINNYGTGTEGIFCYDVSTTDTVAIKKSPLLLTLGSSVTDHPPAPVTYYGPAKGGLQLGPEGKIYVIFDPNAGKIGCINPEKNFYMIDSAAVKVWGRAGLYFPTFNQSIFKDDGKPVALFATSTCSNEKTLLQMNPRYWSPLIVPPKIDSCIWDFGDINSGADNIYKKNPGFHYFSAPGCYEVSLTTYSRAGVFNGKTTIRINAAPTLDVGPADTTLCVNPRKIILNAATNDNPFDDSYEWYIRPDTIPFYEPSILLGNDSSITVDMEGNYIIKKSWKCCSITDTIRVLLDSVKAQFVIDDNIQCLEDNNFRFINTSVPAFTTTTWDFGNTQTDTGDTTYMHYTDPTPFYVKMNTVSPEGCKASLTKSLVVVKHPVAKFIADTLFQCQPGNRFTFTDSTTIEYGHGSLDKWEYDFGDSTSGSVKNTSKSYTTPGIYNVRLIVTSSQDCRDTAYTAVRVYEQPKAGFTVDDFEQCFSLNSFTFTDTSSTDYDTISLRQWTMGDGTPTTDRANLPPDFTKSYSTVDSFIVKLKVALGIGCADSITSFVLVNDNPFVKIKTDTTEQCLQGNIFNFKDTTHVVRGIVNQLQWDFGDGMPIASSGLNKQFGAHGPYAVKLKATTSKGCADSAYANVTVHPMPRAAFTINDSIACFKNHSFVFSAAPSSIPTGSIDSYDWDFGDATGATQQDPLPKTYAKDAPHTIQLHVISDKGCEDTLQRQVSFYKTPVAAIQVNKKTQCLEENIFKYNANASIGPITGYQWDFGDTTYAAGNTPSSKVYTRADTFTVLLAVKTDDNCTDTAQVQVKVLPSPKADFSVDPTCLQQPSVFTDKSTSVPGNIVQWTWRFGDGYQTTGTNPLHTYRNTGLYTVSLDVQSDLGCQATITKINEAVVKALPEVNFSHKRIDFDERNTTIQFTDESTDAIAWLWDLGKGIYSTAQHPQVVYDDTATLPVQLVVRNSEGCFDTLVQTLFIAPGYIFNIPNAFTPNRDDKNPTFGGEGTLYYKNYSLLIYSRWGQLVFKSETPTNKWDGNYNGEPCPEGAYTYLYSIQDIYGRLHNYSGIVNLLR